MSTYTRTLITCLFVALLAYLATPMIAKAGPPTTNRPGEGHVDDSVSLPRYAAGRILVRFRQAPTQASASALLSSYGAELGERIGVDTYTVSVPPGQEEMFVTRLRKDPAVESAMLDLRLEVPLLDPLGGFQNLKPPKNLKISRGNRPFLGGLFPWKSLGVTADKGAGWWSAPSLGATSGGVITDTLRMSTVPDGAALPENTLPTESPQTYAVFDYQELEDEPIRVQVYSLDIESSPIVVFDAVETLNGMGTASIVVPASAHFVESGTFPIGHYLTLVYESVSGSWKAIGTVAWHVSTQPNDRWFLTDRYQWNLHNSGERGTRDADIDAPEAWDVTTGSESVTIAVVSSGVALDHPDLKNKIWKNEDEVAGNNVDDDGNGYIDDVNGYEFFQEDDNPDPGDDIGWGTFAAGIAAAETNNQVGMAGVSWGARIMPIKVVRLLVTSSARIPYGFVSDLIQGLHYAADNGARVIFVAPIVSSAEFEKVEMLRQAVEYAADQGALIVGVVGDQGRDDAVWPALFPQVLGVGATDYNDELTEFTNVGEALGGGLVAPGKLILSTCTSYLPACVSTYPVDVHGQTAWAAAQVAGVASLVWSVNPELSPEEVRQRLEETTDDLGPPGPDHLYGHGRLNAGRAVRWTRHLLHVDVPALFFLVDDHDQHVCRVIRNYATGPFSWSASGNADWLQVSGPTGTFTPSELEVCVLRTALAEYDTYAATLTILSTLDTQSEPVSIPVTVKYIPQKSRAFVPFVTRGPARE